MTSDDLPRFTFPVLFAVLGILMISYGVFTYVRAKNSTNWPVTLAIVTDHDIRDKSQYIDYKYYVDELQYTGNRVSFGVQQHQNIPRVTTGSEITISYDPTKPRNSVWVPGTQNTLRMAWAGLAMIFIGAGIAVFKIKYPFGVT